MGMDDCEIKVLDQLSPDLQTAIERADTAGKISEFSSIAINIILLLLLAIPIGKLIWRRQFYQLPINVKISFIAMIIYALYSLGT